MHFMFNFVYDEMSTGLPLSVPGLNKTALLFTPSFNSNIMGIRINFTLLCFQGFHSPSPFTKTSKASRDVIAEFSKNSITEQTQFKHSLCHKCNQR